jgi:hypothetical protein
MMFLSVRNDVHDHDGKAMCLWQSGVACMEVMDRQLNHRPSYEHDAVKDKDLAGFSRATAIDGRALRTEGNRLVAWSGPHPELVEQTREKHASVEPSTKGDNEAVRLYAFAPPRSPVDRRRGIVFPRAMRTIFLKEGVSHDH